MMLKRNEDGSVDQIELYKRLREMHPEIKLTQFRDELEFYNKLRELHPEWVMNEKSN